MSASAREAAPPFGGIRFLPLIALLYSTSLPCAMRGFHAALSPAFGAPATPAAWHMAQTVSYVFLPSAAPPAVLTGPAADCTAPPAAFTAGLVAVARAGAPASPMTTSPTGLSRCATDSSFIARLFGSTLNPPVM